MNLKIKTRYTQEKGITLIALVITIIVLLILAGVTINMVLGDDGIIAQAQAASQKQEEITDIENIKLAYAARKTDELGNGTGISEDDLQTELGKIYKEGSVEVVADETTGEYTVKIDGDKEYKISLNGTVAKVDSTSEPTPTPTTQPTPTPVQTPEPTSEPTPTPTTEPTPTSSVAQWSITTDKDSDGEADVGDLLTPTVEGLANERFYVIAEDETTLTLLAERNVNTSESVNAQASGDNPVAFDSNSNVYEGSDIQSLVNAYVRTLKGLDLEYVEVTEGGEPSNYAKGRLMWIEEIEKLGGSREESSTKNCPDFINNRTAYWLGSLGENGADDVWSVDGYIEFLYDDFVYYSDFSGLRPVIKILKSNV